MIGRRVRFQNEPGENQGSSKKLKVGTEKDWGRWSPDSLNKERSMRNNKDTIVFFFFFFLAFLVTRAIGVRGRRAGISQCILTPLL